MKFTDYLGSLSSVKQWCEAMTKHDSIYVTGLHSTGLLLWMQGLLKHQRYQLWIVPQDQLVVLYQQLNQILSEDELYLFPSVTLVGTEDQVSSQEYAAQRIQTLMQLAAYPKKRGIILTTLSALFDYLPPKSQWQDSVISLTTGLNYSLTELIDQLNYLGYQRVALTEQPGTFSVRGDILDLFLYTEQDPVRIEFFDTEIDDIRVFDAISQESLYPIEQLLITPVREDLYTSAQLTQAADTLDHLLKQHHATFSEQIYGALTDLKAQWQSGATPALTRLFAPMIYQEEIRLFQYLDMHQDSCFVFDYKTCLEELSRYTAPLREHHLNFSEITQLQQKMMELDTFQLAKEVTVPLTYLSHFYEPETLPMKMPTEQIYFESVPTLEKHYSAYKPLLDEWLSQSYQIMCTVRDKQQADLLFDDWQQQGFSVVIDWEGLLSEDADIFITEGYYPEGGIFPEDQCVLITERELFHKVPINVAAQSSSRYSAAERLKQYQSLSVGDYVVHIHHGIAKYQGIETIVSEGKAQDYLKLAYQNNDILYLPTDQLDKLQKYVASEDKPPRVHRLGGSEWKKTKQKASQKIEDIADELIDLYAQREAAKGYAYHPDTEEQLAFEAAFPFPETPDQIRSIREIKADMEADRPMDRLLVGDVGYGKTEVALRAAFKAIQEGKQVAFLVPTTILAQQHFLTMQERFLGFSVQVAILSRFQTKAEQKKILKDLETGTVDIIVGTHRLLSKDVIFFDLGLMIIDEEQRFGVKHKERLKALRTSVDVLTLTATPIPRTLHLSMLGIRDLSLLETPPVHRMPVQTFVLAYNTSMIQEAILRELDRNGQVFYLYNRVEQMEQKVSMLQSLVPKARIACAHGQMSEMQLERVITDFLQGDYDVLVTTTIIETGIDMPNVNTLIVEHAHRFGLSQLYQLRGRVGRSMRQAYAYLMYDTDVTLTEIGEQRLQAMQDFTELGSGFKLAMRDLSIRGAGNLLGSQQHGFIDAIGFDLYTQLLSEAVARKKGIAQEMEVSQPVIDVLVEAWLPNSYIADERQKVELYQKIRRIENREDLLRITDVLIDRFGPYPDSVAYLLSFSYLRALSSQALITKIKQTSHEEVVIILEEQALSIFKTPDILKALTETSLPANLNMVENALHLSLSIKDVPAEQWINELIIFVSALVTLRKNKV